MNIVNADGTTVALLVGIALGLLAAGTLLALGRAFNPPEPARDPASTNPYGILHVDDLTSMAEMADRKVRDRMAAKPRLGELPVPDMTLPPPLLGTIPPVARPTIPSAWRPSGNARSADKRWLNGDGDDVVRELARAFREREDRR